MGYFYLVLVLKWSSGTASVIIPNSYTGLEACQVAGQVTEAQSSGQESLQGFYCVPGKPLESD